VDRDGYERAFAMQARVAARYRRQAAAGAWAMIDGEPSKTAIADDVFSAVPQRPARQ